MIRSAVALMLCTGLLGCSFVSFTREWERAQTRGNIEGETVSIDGSGGPTLVVLYQLRDLETVVVDYNVQLEPGPFSFGVIPGRYAIAAFEDLNRDYQHQPGEPLGYLGLEEPVEIAPTQRVKRFDIAMRTDQGVQGGLRLDLRNRNQDPNLPAFRRNVGVVASLDDPRFSSESGAKAFLSPEAFIDAGAVGVFFVEPYDPARIPVLFIHGINGSPQDLRPLMESLDPSRFQAWFAAFPTNFRLDVLANFIELSVRDLGVTHDLRRLYVVAHSMGGLVARAFVHANAAEQKRELIRIFVTLSTPFGGHAAARFAAATPSVATPAWIGDVSWIDMVPGSAFQEKLYANPLPDYIEHHLFFGFLSEEDGDGVVSIESQLDPRAVDGARGGLYPALASHTGIVSEQRVQQRFGAILDAGWERDHSALQPGSYTRRTAVSLADASRFHFQWAESDDASEDRRETFERRVRAGIVELDELLSNSRLLAAVETANRDPALRDSETLLDRDRRWRADASRALADDFTDTECNALLERFVDEHPDIAEIVVTGKRGTNACQSNPTTDYLQADEGWWQRTWHGQKVWHSDLRFDESADAFGVSIHIPLRRSGHGDDAPAPIGVVKALMREPI